MVPAPVLIIKTGTTLPAIAARRQDYEVWITRGLGLPRSRVQVVHVYLDEALPPPDGVAAVVITGSAAMVTDRAAWSERTAAWLREAVERETPLLGICYGHQLLAHALGGKVEDNPRGRNIGTIDVDLEPGASLEPLLAPLGRCIHVPVSHRQAVTELPSGARRLATTARDPNHAFAIGKRALGVQFHPEFDADIVRGYIDARRDQMRIEGLDPDALWIAARDTEHGPSLLRRFAELFVPDATR